MTNKGLVIVKDHRQWGIRFLVQGLEYETEGRSWESWVGWVWERTERRGGPTQDVEEVPCQGNGEKSGSYRDRPNTTLSGDQDPEHRSPVVPNLGLRPRVRNTPLWRHGRSSFPNHPSQVKTVGLDPEVPEVFVDGSTAVTHTVPR